MRTQIMKITPAQAKDLLRFNTHNRSVREDRVERYSADMRNGDWRDGVVLRFAGDIDRDGAILLDGQHCLTSVIRSGVTVNFIVVDGLDLADQEPMDTGASRKLEDTLKMAGEINYVPLATAINWTWRYEGSGKPLPDRPPRRQTMMHNLAPSRAQALKVLQDNPGLRDAVAAGPVRHAATVLKVGRGMAGALYYQQAKLDRLDADVFWDQLDTGLFLPPGIPEQYPVYQLRHALEDNARTVARKYSNVHVAAMIAKAWNIWRRGESVKILIWRRGGSTPEPFPEML